MSGRHARASADREAQRFTDDVRRLDRMGELTARLSDAARAVGFDCVTMVHHVNAAASSGPVVAFSDYPLDYLSRSLARRYFVDDPVLLASERTAGAFFWSELPERLSLTTRHREILAAAAASGLEEGLTVPVNVKGEPCGSCSFGLRRRAAPMEGAMAAAWVGCIAFQQARRILGLAREGPLRPELSPRQLDCLVLWAQGKSDWGIAQLLGLSSHTVHDYLEAAKARYAVATRQQLVAEALAEGHITYADVIPPIRGIAERRLPGNPQGPVQ